MKLKALLHLGTASQSCWRCCRHFTHWVWWSRRCRTAGQQKKQYKQKAKTKECGKYIHPFRNWMHVWIHEHFVVKPHDILNRCFLAQRAFVGWQTAWLGILSGSSGIIWDRRGTAMAQVCGDRCSDWAKGHHCLYSTEQMKPRWQMWPRVQAVPTQTRRCKKLLEGVVINPYCNLNVTLIKKHLNYLLLIAAEVQLGSLILKWKQSFSQNRARRQKRRKTHTRTHTHTHTQSPASKHQHNYLLNSCPINKTKHTHSVPWLQSPSIPDTASEFVLG